MTNLRAIRRISVAAGSLSKQLACSEQRRYFVCKTVYPSEMGEIRCKWTTSLSFESQFVPIIIKNTRKFYDNCSKIGVFWQTLAMYANFRSMTELLFKIEQIVRRQRPLVKQMMQFSFPKGKCSVYV